MRIAIVNDMAMALEALRRVVASDPDHEVAWLARDGQEALEKCRADRPDLILMDLVMPRLDGVAATREIMRQSPCAILIVTASVDKLAAKVFEAMGAGALDAVKTPFLGPEGLQSGRETLLAKIATIRKLIGHAPDIRLSPSRRGTTSSGIFKRLVVMGASSGGPRALATVLSALPSDFAAPILIVQHIDREFVPGLVEWLGGYCALKVSMAQKGHRPRQGEVLVAADDGHLVVTGRGTLTYADEPRQAIHRPSVDVMFDSVASVWSAPAIGVLLTGMGADGAQGLLAMRKAGHHTVAQDQSSSAIYGMPKAAARLGAAVEVLALDAIGPALARLVARSDCVGL